MAKVSAVQVFLGDRWIGMGPGAREFAEAVVRVRVLAEVESRGMVVAGGVGGVRVEVQLDEADRVVRVVADADALVVW